MRNRRLGLVFVVLLFTCGSPETSGNESWRGEIRTLANGSRQVTSPVSGYWTSGQQWQLKETLRLGTASGDGPDVFGRIGAFAVDSGGRIFVFDSFARELRLFDASGVLLGRAGRRGQGPGEFEHVIGMAIADGGPLWIVDGQSARYTVVATDDLAQMNVHSRPGGATFVLPWAGAAALDGALLDAVFFRADRTEAVVRVDQHGLPVDTSRIAVPRVDKPSLGSMSFPIPYAAEALRHVNADGTVWTATTHDYRLTKTSWHGDTITVVTREHAPASLTDTQKDSISSYVRRLQSEFGVQARGSTIPSFAPLLRWVIVDDAGYLWVGRAYGDEVKTVDVFDEQGRFGGSVSLPFTLLNGVLPVVRNRTFYAAVEDKSGAPAIVRANIEGRP